MEIAIAWFVFGGLLLIIEIFTPGFIAACFGIAAIASALFAWIGLPFWSQILIFIAISVISVLFLRPFILRFSGKTLKQELTGINSMIGKVVIVKEDIDNSRNVGSISYFGDIWKARSIDTDFIPAGEKVRIVAVESITMIVESL